MAGRRRWAPLLSVFAVLALAASAGAFSPSERVTQIVSPPAGGLPADGGSDHPAFSQDDRDVRLLAYDSAATNLVPGDVNGQRDVFVLFRSGPLGSLSGRLELVSVSSSGRQANGDSASPSVDGTTGWRPRCVAFESQATNLDRRDRTPDWDVYVRDLKHHSTTLVSLGAHDARDPAIDGRCRFVTFAAGGAVLLRDLGRQRTYRIARGSQPDQQTDGRGVVYVSRGQVYHQLLTVTPRGLRRQGRPFLVSDTRDGSPGNGVSADPVVDDRGRYVAFDSTASDLCEDRDCGFPTQFLGRPCPVQSCMWHDYSPDGDVNGHVSDVFRRSLVGRDHRPGGGLRMLSWSGVGQGNGPSTNPAISRAGRDVVFQTIATNLNGDGGAYFNFNGPTSDIVSWYLRLAAWPFTSDRTQVLVESSSGSGLDKNASFNGASTNPAMSSRGNYIAFTSRETGLAGESNGATIPDLFMRYMGPPVVGDPGH